MAKAKAASETENKEDKAAWMARKEAALKNHEAVLNLHGHKIKQIEPQIIHQCVVTGCFSTGTLSSGTKGSDNWYCIKHSKTTG
ncbi:hypothetical protein [Methylobacter sp.]|uniref:hypothetical protein n=1 Tax=Methylobacter sp. TaxID=2051955 RepID=UPI002FDEB412